jgi:hypothetical protein
MGIERYNNVDYREKIEGGFGVRSIRRSVADVMLGFETGLDSTPITLDEVYVVIVMNVKWEIREDFYDSRIKQDLQVSGRQKF